MAPNTVKRTPFQGGGVAVIDPERCSQCGLCSELCRFDAVREDFHIDELDCEGCGVCVDFCPEGAIDFPVKTCGEWYISQTRFGPMVHARLGIAEENSGKLVTLVRQQAKMLAEKSNLDLIITDGPPGVGCPVIASMGGATAVLIVTEPTVSGLHDMDRVVQLANHFKMPCMVCINKWDLNPDQTMAVQRAAEKRRIPVFGKIPFDPAFTESMIEGKNILEYDHQSEAGREVKRLWERIMASTEMNGG
jgi:MinD superfamily P-loop ATPase